MDKRIILTRKQKRQRAFLNACRKAFTLSNVYDECKNLNKSTNLGKRGGQLYTCQCCHGDFKSGDVEVDHLQPVTKLDTRQYNMSNQDVIDRVFVTIDQLQLLCIECHKVNTNNQRKLRTK